MRSSLRPFGLSASEIMPWEFPKLFCEMLFPNDPMMAGQMLMIFENEAQLGAQVIEEEGASCADAEGPQKTDAVRTIQTKARARTEKGFIAGAVSLSHVRLLEQWSQVTIGKAIWLASKRWAHCTVAGREFSKNKPNKDASEHYAEKARQIYSEFWPVTHFWAAWSVLDYPEKKLVWTCKRQLLEFLILADAFRSRLARALSGSEERYSRKPSELLKVCLPENLRISDADRLSDGLSSLEVEWLNDYSRTKR